MCTYINYTADRLSKITNCFNNFDIILNNRAKLSILGVFIEV